jgi:hypothetical protein
MPPPPPHPRSPPHRAADASKAAFKLLKEVRKYAPELNKLVKGLEERRRARGDTEVRAAWWSGVGVGVGGSVQWASGQVEPPAACAAWLGLRGPPELNKLVKGLEGRRRARGDTKVRAAW